MLARAERFAQLRGDATIRTSHLLLAIIGAFETPWPRQIVERGGLNFEQAVRRLGWSQVAELERVIPHDMRLYRASMRLRTVVLVTSVGVFVARVWRGAPKPASRPRADLGTIETIDIAHRLAKERRSAAETPITELQVGHLLLALASTPGGHLRLLDNSTVLACAVRRELGLDAWHHRLILRLERPNLEVRRLRMRLERRVNERGRMTRWGLMLLCFRAGGLILAAGMFPVTVLANVLLYLFLWPASLLMGGIRALVGMIVGCDVRSRRWHEIPGGEVSLAGGEARIHGRRLAAVILLPRCAGFVLSVIAMVFVEWRAQRLGVVIFPTLYSRPDVLAGLYPDSIATTPVAVLGDATTQNGLLGGIGILAGLGTGMMSIPTYRELQLIRIHAGHEVGLGSPLARAITLPASILTGAFACIEAFLPIRNSPFYLTVYLLPLAISLVLAAAIVALLPY